MSDYTAVAPPGADATLIPVGEIDTTGMTPTQARLAALKAKLNTARNQNHKEVVAEDRRNKLGPEALKKQRAERSYNKLKEGAIEGKRLQTEDEKMMATTAELASTQMQKEEKKEKRRGE